MKRLLLLLLLLALMCGIVNAAEYPVFLSYTFIDYTEDSDAVYLNFVLHVKNISDITLQKLSLAYVPLVLVTRENIDLYIGDMKPGDIVDLPFSIPIPVVISKEEILENSLFWDGEYWDDNKIIGFPAESIPNVSGI